MNCCDKCVLNTKGDAYDYDVHCTNKNCKCHSPAKNCPIEDCTRENGHVGFHIWERDTVSSAKDQTECCDGECNHDACCGKIPENCTHSTESVSGEEFKEVHCDGSCANPTHGDQPQSEWEREFDEMVRDFTEQGFMAKSEARRRFKELALKEYERGREDRGESLGTISLDDFRKQIRNDTLDEIVELVKKYWTFDDGQRHTHSWHSRADFLEEVNRLKANRDI